MPAVTNRRIQADLSRSWVENLDDLRDADRTVRPRRCPAPLEHSLDICGVLFGMELLVLFRKLPGMGSTVPNPAMVGLDLFVHGLYRPHSPMKPPSWQPELCALTGVKRRGKTVKSLSPSDLLLDGQDVLPFSILVIDGVHVFLDKKNPQPADLAVLQGKRRIRSLPAEGVVLLAPVKELNRYL